MKIVMNEREAINFLIFYIDFCCIDFDNEENFVYYYNINEKEERRVFFVKIETNRSKKQIQ
jgi:NADH:ubiquinone oxidoreductase subunit C